MHHYLSFCFMWFLFLYIGSVSLVVYVIYRLMREKKKFTESIPIVLEMIFEYLLGVGLSAFIFIPAVVGFLSSDRVGMKANLPVVYSMDVIVKYVKNMFLPSYSSEQELIVCTIGMIIVVCVLTAHNKQKEKLNLDYSRSCRESG